MKKYELIDETKVIDGTTLRRIKALKDFDGVKNGIAWAKFESKLSPYEED